MCYKSPRKKCGIQCCQRSFKDGIHFLWNILLDECATEPIWGNDLIVTFLRTYYTPDALPALRLLVLQGPHYPILQMRASEALSHLFKTHSTTESLTPNSCSVLGTMLPSPS